ncbi:PTS system, ascorbate-specific IIA component [Spiroplasma chinense]|uniref:Ascorbate-specific PTS system EIIA component n=1 Tax=Spiroplasma chinense TaxID=216932 RepID=A0A5B9Y5A7_9MOLU|nr:PTS sugar transporter subunit IIA [Spiroplasma chinense]QEH62005.1 PTS system, ascorbate-specific IIA component [Spiroplasma chinense]
MTELNFLNSLLENRSILINQEANDWKDAITACFQPLLKNGVISEEYIKGVIDSTLKYGPYYIICPNVAMPHASSESGALKNGFSIMTLKKPVLFDKQEISVLIGFAAVNSEVHMTVALPQIVAIFENESTVDKIANSKSEEELKKIIEGVDFLKYLK